MSERFRLAGGVALAVAAVAFMFWAALTEARWRGPVDVLTAESHPDGRLAIEAKSCNGNPELSHLEETEPNRRGPGRVLMELSVLRR